MTRTKTGSHGSLPGTPQLAFAVSEAGGPGSLPCVQLTSIQIQSGGLRP